MPVLKSIRDTLTRSPFGPREKPPAVAVPPVPAGARTSLLIFGRSDSVKNLSQLEALREAVRACPESLRGVILGLPFDRVERTLRSVRFNTGENLLSFNAPRVNLRFEHEATGTVWHIAASEFERTGAPPAGFVPGATYPVAPELLFADWEAAGPDRMKNLHTRREIPRPAELVFRQSFKMSGGYGYDGVAGGQRPDEIIERLKQLEPLGLNATNFVRALLVLIQGSGRNLTSPALYRMLTDDSERMLMIEYMAASFNTTNPWGTLDELGAARDCVMEMHDRVPPMALSLARKLLETYLGRDLVTRDDLLVPGKLWHIDTSTDSGRYLAYCVKQDIQSQVLRLPQGDDLTMIFSGEWEQFDLLELDVRCLMRKDVLLCYMAGKPQRILDRQGAALIDFIRSFPRHYWHLSSGEAETEIFDRTYPYVAHARQQIAYLSWEHRLEEIDGRMREAAVDLNVDGLEILERAGRSKLKRTIERGGFAQD